jgi:hypothetical protein
MQTRNNACAAVGGSWWVSIGLLAALVAVPPRAGAQSAPPPDLTGVWSVLRGGGEFAPPPATALSLRPGYAEAYSARQAETAEAIARGEPLPPTSFCLPYGVPTMMAVAVYPVEIIQTPRQVTIIAEAFSEVRRVYMDEPQLEIDEVPPGYYGHSVGRWEADTLVIDTVGIREDIRGYDGMPHSREMRVTERIRLVAPDILHDEITIDDPVVLEQPVAYTLAYRRLPGYKMVEFVCDNNREYVDENGVVRMRLGSGEP